MRRDEQPDWMEDVEESASFGLTAMDGPELMGQQLQEVQLTREEYGELKTHLAILRGLGETNIAASSGALDLSGFPHMIDTATLPDEINKLIDEYAHDELADFANYLNRARWIYRHAPQLLTADEMPEHFAGVITDSGTLDTFARIVWEPGQHAPFSFLADPTEPNLRERLAKYAIEGRGHKSLEEFWQGQLAVQAEVAPRDKQDVTRLGAIAEDKTSDHEPELAAYLRIMQGNTGCNTPFHEFFDDLVMAVVRGRIPTPDQVAEDLETFRDNFASMARDTRNFVANYPDTLKEAA